MFHKILLAYDGSDPAGHAFKLALDLSVKYGADLRLLSVARPPEFGEEVESDVEASARIGDGVHAAFVGHPRDASRSARVKHARHR